MNTDWKQIVRPRIRSSEIKKDVILADAIQKILDEVWEEMIPAIETLLQAHTTSIVELLEGRKHKCSELNTICSHSVLHDYTCPLFTERFFFVKEIISAITTKENAK